VHLYMPHKGTQNSIYNSLKHHILYLGACNYLCKKQMAK
jgi:hypothetical protein